jgi:hypothetical protein
MKYVILMLLVTAFIFSCKGKAENKTENTAIDQPAVQAISEQSTHAGERSISFKANEIDYVLNMKTTGMAPSIHYIDAMKKGNVTGGVNEDLSLTLVFDTEQLPGPVPETGGSAKGNFQLRLNKVNYNSFFGGGEMHINVTDVKETPHAKFINGTFEGKLKNIKKEEIVITEGKFSGF